MALITGKNSLFASVLAAIGASVCCVGITDTWDRRCLGRKSDGTGTLSPDLHRADAAISRFGLLPALPCTAALRLGFVLRCLSPPQAATVHFLAGCNTAARPVGRALARPAVLLREDHHAPTTDCPARQLTLGSTGRPAGIHYARRAEHDLRSLSDHGEEGTTEGTRGKCGHCRSRQENGHCDLRPRPNHERSAHHGDNERGLPLHRAEVMSHEYPCS